MEGNKDLTAVLDEIREIAADMGKAAGMLAGASGRALEIISALERPAETDRGEADPVKPQRGEPPEPAPGKVITKAEVRKVLAAAADGHRAEVKALLTKYGADNLTRLDPAHYAAIMADAEGLMDA